MNLDAIFLHAGFRTGGTALALAFRALPKYELLYDPLNTAFNDSTSILQLNSNEWASNHSNDFYYFSEYSDFINLDDFFNYNDSYRFDYFGATHPNEFINYISNLISYSKSRNSIPVMKFETSEGRIKLLKQHFPSSLNIGITRDIDAQEISWLEQSSLGSVGFFEAAYKIIKSDPTFFGLKNTIPRFENELESNLDLFRKYETARRSLLKNCDLLLDMTNEYSWQSSLDMALSLDNPIRDIVKDLSFSYSNVEKPITLDLKFRRLLLRNISTNHELEKALKELESSNANAIKLNDRC